MTEFTEVANLEDVPPGERKRVEVNDALISLFNIDGELFAIYDRCPHKKTAPLVRGTLKGLGIKCPNHGYCFDLKTGECDRGTEWNTRTYQVKTDNGKILVSPHQRPLAREANSKDSLSRDNSLPAK